MAGANLNDQFGQAAFYVDRILRGEKPADLPVQQPSARVSPQSELGLSTG
jgi:ABC-type uncharacterized transport system substrate-binding protein